VVLGCRLFMLPSQELVGDGFDVNRIFPSLAAVAAVVVATVHSG
jgi:hypothetical protein